MATRTLPSPCWQGAWDSAFRCCLGQSWGVPSEAVEECWQHDRSYERCCVTDQILMESEIKAWQLQHAVGCGCSSKEFQRQDAFCMLKTFLRPKVEQRCLWYSYTYIVGLLADFARKFSMMAARHLQAKDIPRCVPGMLLTMVADLTMASMGDLDVLHLFPSYRYLNQALPLALEALPMLSLFGWNILGPLRSLKMVVQQRRYGHGTPPSFVEPCEATEETLTLLSAVLWAVAEKDARALRRAARAVPAEWRLERWSLKDTCHRGRTPGCCEVPATLALAGVGNSWNKDRLRQGLEFAAAAAKGDWLQFLWSSSWPVLEILEVFTPWRDRAIALQSVQNASEEDSCFLPSLDSAPVPAVTLPSSRRAAPGVECQDRIAVLLRGRGFVWRRGSAGRAGHYNLPESVLEQLAAARSHLRFAVRPLEALGYRVDVYGATYPSPYLPDLEAQYGSNLRQSFSIRDPPGDQFGGVLAALEALPTSSCVQWVLLLRIDLMLKHSLVPTLQRAWRRGEEFLAPFWCESGGERIGGPLCVSDVMQVFPGSWRETFAEIIREEKTHRLDLHDWLDRVLRRGANPSNVGVLVPRRFISDPGGQWNPLYDFANRERRGPVSTEERDELRRLANGSEPP